MPDKKEILQHQAIITITPTGKKSGNEQQVQIYTQYQVLRKKPEDNGIVNCHIPAYDIYFDAPDMDESLKRASFMVGSFLDYWANRKGFKKFTSQILKLGFRAPDALTTKKLAFG